MAGSYNHVTTDAGELRQHSFEDMIENLGDAYEAIEEMYGMIWFLAARLADWNAGTEPADVVADAECRYKEGLALAPGPEASR